MPYIKNIRESFRRAFSSFRITPRGFFSFGASAAAALFAAALCYTLVPGARPDTATFNYLIEASAASAALSFAGTAILDILRMRK